MNKQLSSCSIHAARFAQVRYIKQMKTPAPSLSLVQLLVCGALIVTLAMGIRHGFGLWLQPITQAKDWSRETFSFAMAIQNLAWGFAGVFAGMVADRFGAFNPDNPLGISAFQACPNLCRLGSISA